MAYVQLLDLGDGRDTVDVAVVEAMAGQDDQSHLPRGLGRRGDLLQFWRPGAAFPGVSVLAGIDLDFRTPDALALPDLIEIGIDEDGDVDGGVEQLADDLLQVAGVQHDIEAALGGDLVAALGDQGHLMRFERLGHARHFRVGRHLDVEVCGHDAPQQLDVAILDVPAIAPEVYGNALGAGQLADHGGSDGVRLCGLPPLPDGGRVVDVEGQAHGRRGSG